MKPLSGVALAALLSGFLLLRLFAPPPAVSALPSPQMPPPLYCASDDGKRRWCPMDTRGGVQLYKQRSGSPCLFGQTWGFDARGVWVDRGCRADFVSGYTPGPGPGGPGGNWPGWGNNYNVYCASDDGRRNRCPVDTSRGVRLVRQRSGSPCNYGSTWGYDRSGIWVDRGCRADFEIAQAGWQPAPAQTIYCASNNMQRNYCRADTSRGARIIRQRSVADCIYQRTWGYDRGGIWVDRGCRADFELVR
jgi:hypothetical protein